MRRSAAISLTLLAGAGLGLAFCTTETPDTEGVLETQAACVQRLGDVAATECAAVFADARATHAASAPRFASPEACQAATGGDCTPLSAQARPAGTDLASTATAMFIPAMAGVMIGQALSNGTRGATPVYAGVMPPGCQPGGLGPACPSGASGTSGGGGGGVGSGGSSGRRYWYSGTSYAGFSDASARGGFRPATPSAQGQGMLARGAGSASISARAGTSSSRAGGLGFSAAAHSGGGS